MVKVKTKGKEALEEIAERFEQHVNLIENKPVEDSIKGLMDIFTLDTGWKVGDLCIADYQIAEVAFVQDGKVMEVNFGHGESCNAPDILDKVIPFSLETHKKTEYIRELRIRIRRAAGTLSLNYVGIDDHLYKGLMLWIDNNLDGIHFKRFERELNQEIETARHLHVDGIPLFR